MFNQKGWSAVGAELTQENVDDGINIKAARKRWADNKDTWKQYVDATVLCRSERTGATAIIAGQHADDARRYFLTWYPEAAQGQCASPGHRPA